MTSTHLDHLAELLRHSVQAGTPPMKACLTAVASEAHERYLSGRKDDYAYFQQLVIEISRLRGATLADLRIGCLFDASRYLYLVADNEGSQAASKFALDLSREFRERALEWRAHQLLGIAYCDSMNVSLGIEHFVDGIKITQELRDSDATGSLAVEIAIAYNAIGQHKEARDCLQFALRLHGEGAQRSWYTAAMTRFAETQLHLGLYAKGLEAIEKAVASAREPQDAHDLMAALEREAVYVRLLHKLDRIQPARQRTIQARALAERSGTSRALAKIDLLESMCDVHEQNFDVGITRLTQRLEASRKSGVMASLQREILAELVHAHDQAGDPRKAKILLSEQQEVMRKSGQEVAVKQHRQHMESVGISRRTGATSGAYERYKVVLQGKVAGLELAEIDRFQKNIEMLEAIAVSAELGVDPDDVGDTDHIYRVGRLAALIAEESGLPDTPDDVRMIEMAARLHDIGMGSVPREALYRQGPLSPEERRLIERHTLHGAELLSKMNMPQLTMAIDVARHHHEHWDGGGYPSNLSGSAIPFAARVTTIADVFDAMRHKRRYREALSFEATMRYLADGRGTQFDPQLVDCAIAVITRLRHAGPDVDLALTTQESRLARARMLMKGLVASDGSVSAAQAVQGSSILDLVTPLRSQ